MHSIFLTRQEVSNDASRHEELCDPHVAGDLQTGADRLRNLLLRRQELIGRVKRSNQTHRFKIATVEWIKMTVLCALLQYTKTSHEFLLK